MTEAYKVVWHRDIDVFMERCNLLIEQGYIPVGGLVKGEREFFQAFSMKAKPGRPAVKKGAQS